MISGASYGAFEEEFDADTLVDSGEHLPPGYT